MKNKSLPFLLLFLLCYPSTRILAQGKIYVYNGSETTDTFRLYINGVLTSTPTAWVNVPAHSQTAGLVIGFPVGSSAIARSAAYNDYCQPTGGVDGWNGGTLVYMGTNDCIQKDTIVGVTNLTGKPHIYAFTKNGTRVDFGVSSTFPLAPGESWSWSFPQTICANGSYDKLGVVQLTQISVITTTDSGSLTSSNRISTNEVATTGTNNTGWGDTFGTKLTNSTPGVLWSQVTNAAIDFTGTSSTAARDDTLKAGLSAIVSELQGIKGGIDQGTAAALQNGSGGGVPTDPVVPDLPGFQYIPSSEASGSPSLGSVPGLFDGGVSALGSPADFDGASGSPDVFHIEFVNGTTLNLDPEVRIPGAMGMVKAIFTLLATLAFVTSMVTLYKEAAMTYAVAQTGGVPNYDATILGTGGNAIGVTLSLALPVVIVALWVVLFESLFAMSLGTEGILSAVMGTLPTKSSSVLSSITNPGTRYLLVNTIPLSLMLSYIWTRIIATFTIAKLVMVAASVMRFINNR